jgi:hypothetical protein
MKDFAIQLTHRPGDLARVASALAHKSVNVKSLAAMSAGGQGVVHIYPDDATSARTALEEANIRFTESELHTVLLENKAGRVAEVTDRLGDEGINLDAVYVTGVLDDLVEIAFVGDNPKKIKKVLEEF